MALKSGWEDLGNGLVRNTSVYGGVVDVNNPIYTNAADTGAAPAGQPSATGGAPSAAPTNQKEAATAASTYSSTPGAAPAEYTANQGGQDVMRNALIAQMSQDQVPTVDDPAIQAQLNPYAAAMERARRDEVRAGAEEAFGGGQDYGSPEKMAASERAGQKTGLFASQLVGKEMSDRRQQISDALSKFGGLLSQDQSAALQREMAKLDAQLKREGMAQTGELGRGDLSLRDRLGTQSNGIDLLRTLFGHQEFGQDLGFRIGANEGDMNYKAMMALLQG